MCQECGVTNGHTTPCPNNPKCNLDEPELVKCPVCEQEVPDEQILWGVCDECLGKAGTFENAMAFGAENKVSVEINGYLAHEFSAGIIEEALRLDLAICILAGRTDYHGYLSDDPSAFADWLKEQKKR